jgi:hypothetical protein
MRNKALRVPNPVHERMVFLALTALILVIALIGFWPTYYGAGMVHAPLPDLIVHLHAIVMTLWFLILIVQVGLVSGRRIDLHRRFGMIASYFAAAVVVVGLIAATDALRRDHVSVQGSMSVETFSIILYTDITSFATLIYLSYRARRKPATHKRLVIFANYVLMGPAIARFRPPFATVPIVLFAIFVIPLTLMVYDSISMRKFPKVTVFAFLCVAIVDLGRLPLGHTRVWQAFATAIHNTAKK